MTPMIDVLLVLVIIFMIIMPLAPKGFRADVPQDATPAVIRSENTVVVEVDREGKFLVNQTPTAADSLESRLAEIFKLRAQKLDFVKGNGELEYQAVVPLLVAARGAGIDRVGLLTK